MKREKTLRSRDGPAFGFLAKSLTMAFLRKFWEDEQAQATTEYILMLIAALSFFMMLYAKLLKPIVLNLGTTISSQIQSSFFGGDFHHLNIGQ